MTDASRAEDDDGFGGYAFAPTVPDVVFLMSSPWPVDVKRAVDAAAAPKARRGAGQVDGPLLSMPAGEVFASLALAEAVVRHLGQRFHAVIAVGDCSPAARALSCRYSRSPQMRALTGASTRSADRWLGVHVPREWNVDADCLSHPSRAGGVCDTVAASGLLVCRLDPPRELWSLLREVVRLPLGRDDLDWEVEVC